MHVGFQYDYIRNFIIGFHYLKIDKLNTEKIRELASTKINEDLARSVFRYIERISNGNTQKILRDEFSKYYYSRAMDFIKYYQNILDIEFPVIRNRFKPYTKGEIGLLVFYHLNPYFKLVYGFREISGNEERVIWIQKENWFKETTDEDRWKIARRYGIKTLASSSLDFTDIEPRKFAENEIREQLRKLIEARMLDESQNAVLQIEYVLDIMSKNSTLLGLPDFDQDFWKNVFPVSIEKLIERTETYLQGLRASLEAKFGSSFTLIPSDLDKFLSYLYRLKKRQSTIERTLLPFPSKYKIPRLGAWLYSSYSLEELRDYLVTFFRLVLQEYKILVDHNLSHFCNSMETYKALPIRVIGEIDVNGSWPLTYCFVSGEDDISVEIIVKGKESIFDWERGLVHTSTGDKNVLYLAGSGMDMFFESDSKRDNIIQKHVYELIFSDLEKIFDW